jgi:ABC-type transport system substrate-binding protein
MDDKQLSVIESMAGEAGFKFTRNLVNSTEYVQYRDGQGKYQGMSYRAQPGGNSSNGSDPLEALLSSFSVKYGGRNYSGFDANGKGDFSGDPYLEDLFTRGRAEPNADKRKAIVHDIQRHTAKKAYMIRWPGGASGFSLRWPTVRNYGVIKDDLRGDIMGIWLDPSLPPNRL